MKIAFEGMDGVGKSTIARQIAVQYNMKYIEKPLIDCFFSEAHNSKKIFFDICQNIYGFDSEILKAWFFGLGNLYTFIENKNNDIVIDRHFASNYFWNGTQKSNEIFQTMINLIGVPDITIVLYAPLNVRMERIKMRDKYDYDLIDPEKKVDGYEKMYKFLDEFNVPYCVVNTENKTIDEVVNEAACVIENYIEKEKIKKIG